MWERGKEAPLHKQNSLCRWAMLFSATLETTLYLAHPLAAVISPGTCSTAGSITLQPFNMRTICPVIGFFFSEWKLMVVEKLGSPPVTSCDLCFHDNVGHILLWTLGLENKEHPPGLLRSNAKFFQVPPHAVGTGHKLLWSNKEQADPDRSLNAKKLQNH